MRSITSTSTGPVDGFSSRPSCSWIASEIAGAEGRSIGPLESPQVPNRYPEFVRHVTAVLHYAGVPLIAGTDARGAPLIAPGSSLHRELELLNDAGLTPRHL